MGLFDRWFGKRRGDNGSQPMRLHLQYPPLPEYAAKHAQIAVDATRVVTGADLDYSPGSLAEVDRIIMGFRGEGLKANQVAETVFSFGCYLGEVMVRQHQAVWKMAADTNLPEAFKEDNTMVVELSDGVFCNPIGKAFKLLEQGEGESLAYFYQVFTRKG
jgi:hypothetical protein